MKELFMLRFAACFGLIFAFTVSNLSAQERYSLRLGKLKVSSSFAEQSVVVNNGTDSSADIQIECGFFSGEKIVGTGSAYAEKVPAGKRAFKDVIASGVGEADHAECRIIEK